MEEFDLDVVLRLQSNKWIVYGVWRLQALEEMVGKEMKCTQHGHREVVTTSIYTIWCCLTEELLRITHAEMQT